MPTFGVILAAAGQSSRFQDPNYKKPFAPLAGRPVWLQSAEKFTDRPDVKQVVVVDASIHEHFYLNLLVLDLPLLASLELGLSAGCGRHNGGVNGCAVEVESWIPAFRELMLSHDCNLL